MALISQKNTTPPDGWNFTQPETKTVMRHETLPELVDMVRLHRLHKGLKPDDREGVQLDIERQICLAQFPGVCHPEPGEEYRPLQDISRTLNLAKIESLSFAAFEFVKSGARMVDEETAQKRAAICHGCKFNHTPNACMCTPLWKFITSLIPDSRRIAGLQICAVCGCSIQAKILMPENVLRHADEGRDIRYPDYCWNKHANA